MSDADQPECTVPKQYTVPEVAAQLGVSVRMVYKLVEAGDIEITKIGRASRVSARNVNAYLARSAAQTEPSVAPADTTDETEGE